MEHTGCNVVIFHELGQAGLQALDCALDAEAGAKVRGLSGFHGLLRGDLTDLQVTPDAPHRYEGLVLLSFSQAPTADLVDRLSAWIQELKKSGLIAGYSAHVFEWIRPLKERRQGELMGMTHVNIVMGNASPGQDEGYHAWYDNHHLADLLAAPGPVAFRRGGLSRQQISPDNAQPAAYLVLMASRTDDLRGMVAELTACTFGTSASGVRFEPRPAAVSDNRTIDVFRARRPLEGGL